MIKLKNKKSIFVILSLTLLIGLILNINVSIRQGVNGHIRYINMPLYVKAVEFLARHYEYKRLAGEITVGAKTDEDKALAVFEWTHKNIRKIPPNFPAIDDHVLNIIIRGYGACDQSEDVFTTLSAYSGIPAFWERVYDNAHRSWYPLAFVKIGGKWRVFDAYCGKYFKNRTGEIASVEDMVNDKSIFSADKDLEKIANSGIPYREYYGNLHLVSFNRTLRPEKQMPFKRVIFEVRKLMGIKREVNAY